MKSLKLLFTFIFAFSFISGYAQQKIKKDKNDKTIINIMVPNKMKIDDNLYIINESPYSLLKVVVALDNGDYLMPIGYTEYIKPNDDEECDLYDKNWHENLHLLRGKNIAVKIKGYKDFIGSRNKSISWSPSDMWGSTDTSGSGINSEQLSNLDKSKITYDFDISLKAKNHDLYIIVNAKKMEDLMDF